MKTMKFSSLKPAQREQVRRIVQKHGDAPAEVAQKEIEKSLGFRIPPNAIGPCRRFLTSTLPSNKAKKKQKPRLPTRSLQEAPAPVAKTTDSVLGASRTKLLGLVLRYQSANEALNEQQVQLAGIIAKLRGEVAYWKDEVKRYMDREINFKE